ncbi:aminotransferase class I/II-fold pyridoxal phosphate-dependent enzyme, partial [bacterium]
MKKEMIEKLVRDTVREFEPYVPGKPIHELKRELGLRKVYKLASNENSLGCSPKVLEKLKKNLDIIYRYPETSCFKLKERLSNQLKINKSCFLFGNGSDEIIELLGKTFLNKEDEIITSKHAFIRYAMAGRLMDCKVVEVPMIALGYDTESILGSITNRTKIIFIGNPN